MTETFKIRKVDCNDVRDFPKTATYNTFTGKFSKKVEKLLKENPHQINTNKKLIIFD